MYHIKDMSKLKELLYNKAWEAHGIKYWILVLHSDILLNTGTPYNVHQKDNILHSL